MKRKCKNCGHFDVVRCWGTGLCPEWCVVCPISSHSDRLQNWCPGDCLGVKDEERL